ncbi:hypothetical protein [Wenzhouxiangella sp. EGI_FJ10409]|uniref:hypothetical protein n=1 Tax=Wenzhouxiangella sp. EGI_FJ10409 TaxID=3243767 RepID=UPI0035D7499D
MKHFRLTTTIAALTLAGVSSIALARGPVDHLAERLDLDEQQTATLTVLFDEYRDHVAKEIDWRDADGKPDPEARQQVRNAREALDREILAVLDAEQAEAYTRMREERKGQRGGKRHGPGHGRVLGQLDLSEAQEEALRTLIAERKARHMQDRARFRDDLESILSDEQLAQWSAMRENRRGKHRDR